MRLDALRGHLDALIIAVVEPEPSHGYAIMQALRERSRGSLEVPTGTLYPALRRLERAGFLRSTWTTVDGRRRRVYEVTAAGRRKLADERSEWRELVAAIGGVFSSKPASEGR